MAVAERLFEELSIPPDLGTLELAAQAIRLLVKEAGTIDTAYKYIFQAGETINRFWFSDQKYRPQNGKSNGRQKTTRVY